MAIIIAAFLLLLLVSKAAGLAWAGDPAGTIVGEIERGRQVYEAQRCALCHSIAGEGNRRYPLDGVGKRLTSEQLRTWIVSPRTMKPTVRKPTFDLAPAELAAILAYLQSLATNVDVEQP